MVYSRIFLFSCLLCIFQQVNASTQCTSTTYQVLSPNLGTFQSLSSACSAVHNHMKTNQPDQEWKSQQIQGNAGISYCREYVSTGQYDNHVAVYEIPSTNACDCPAKDSIHSGAGLRKNGELFTPPSTICINKCLYDFSTAMAAQEVRNDGTITTLFYGDAKSLASQCSVDTEDDTPPPINPCRTRNAQGQFVDRDYCDAPPNGCPSGYIQGMFNGRKICVKQDTNNQDNCRATPSDPYRCLPDRPQEPTNPNNEGNCENGTVQVIIGTTLKCVTPEVPPNPNGDCPNNYVKQTYDGVSTCVPDNQRPDNNNNCPLNTSIKTLPDGTSVCSSNGGNDNGSGASEPTGESGSGQCNPETDFLCKDFDLPVDQKLDVKDVDLPEIDENKISWSQSCPADETVNVMGKTYAFKYNDACNFLSTYIHPLMVALGYLTGALIIVGAARK